MAEHSAAMDGQISVGEVTDLGGGLFRVRLEWNAGHPEAALSQTQTVSAEGSDAAVRIAKDGFLRWLKNVAHVAKNANWGGHKPN